MDIKTIKEYRKKSASQLIGDHLKLAWCFETWWEKLILVGLGILGLWKLGGLIF